MLTNNYDEKLTGISHISLSLIEDIS